ncbi:MAG TPA: phospho-sugar mutase [Terrimesophilobacter sp.]|nr:phospho-sugar mutase [Terrimesophilobacter sp.]
MSADVLDAARAWHDQDPDPETRAELDALIAAAERADAEALDELHARFDARLEFGTAGLRAELAAGPNRMNRVLVAQAARGFANFLLEREAKPSVVIGYDGRKNSHRFALDTAELMAGAGLRAILLPRLLPSPVLAFAVRHFGVSAGVMVTASHNPPRDNGYKVYLGGVDEGSQIVPPDDEAIEAAIRAVAAQPITRLPRSNDYEVANEEIVDAYVAQTAGLVTRAPSNALKVVYTAMHGVGWETTRAVFAAAGFAEPVVVVEQRDPDPDFPTVAFPNPEEPGALDLSYATADAAKVDLIIANDPDADRLAVAIPVEGGWRALTGNEVGMLLGWRAAEAGARQLAASLVSSPALGAVAQAYGIDFTETLTGFKWVSRVPGLDYGYEEALGYLVDPQKVRDKDGISAAVAFLDLADSLATSGISIEQHLVDFAERFGAFASGQVSVRVTDVADIPRIMARVRATPPTTLGGAAVVGVDDFAQGLDAFPPANIVRFRLEGASRVIVRPSGTEPKVKVYLDAASTTGSGEERIAAATAQVAALEADMRDVLA